MLSYPSRSEKRYNKLFHAATKGYFSVNPLILYPGEITKLEKEGFKVYSIKPYSENKSLFTATVDWSDAFGIAIPLIVHNYISGIVNCIPKSYHCNFAQELYIIAKKSLTNT